MLINVVTKRRFKFLAVFVAVNLIAQIGFPTVAFALTSGPSQPESGSFEPVNTNQMVDLFSGDFTYNIPLMNVPGPNGGYPINLAYNAGIGMEQEASWVGLGWNINAGVINRNLRGLPDDFQGDEVKKTIHMRPQRRITISGGVQLDTEIFGVDPNVNLQAGTGYYYDSYMGVGSTSSIGLSTMGAAMSGGLMITSDSKDGLGVSPSVSYEKKVNDNANRFSFGLNFNSRQGLSDITFRHTRTSFTSSDDGSNDTEERQGTVGTSFSSSTYVPISEMPKGGFAGEFEMELGTEAYGTNVNPLYVKAAYVETNIAEETIDFEGYGYLYAENRGTTRRSLADFNREKNIPVNRNSKALPVPIATYDVFAVKGQGVGGAFRTFRSDIGVLTDPTIEGSTTAGGFGIEVGTGNGIKIGANPKISTTKSYSGPWKGENDGVVDWYKYEGRTVNDAYEPAYFKPLGEMVETVAMAGGSQNSSEKPFRFNMGLKYKLPFSRVPIVRPTIREYYGPSTQLTAAARIPAQTREKKVQSIEYITRDEMDISYGTAGYAANHTFTNSGATGFSDAAPYAAPVHHLEEISVVNPDGNRYVYGLPAYNTEQKDVLFSVVGVVDGKSDQTGRTRSYVKDDDNTTGNSKGLNNVYSATEMPAYAHSYLLTEVLSPDYVDLTGNGPSDDDLGYWVKFNYIEKSGYEWRAPYEQDKGNNIENKISNDEDDQSGYSYGVKEIMYLESIETKTHVAEYYLSEREDGLGVTDENGGKDTNQKLLRLDKIVLRSKSDLTKAIKTVHFAYDYSLCQGIPNNTNALAVGNRGKLTLKKVWFTYLDNDVKGALSPYEFVYADVDHDDQEDTEANPNYKIENMDRWGNYQGEGPFEKLITSGAVDPDQRYPYSNQNGYPDRHTHASAWNLTRVIMPSGGILKIDYESDDYAYVQNEPAQQMFQIIGTGTSSGLNTPEGSDPKRYPLSKDDDRIYIKLNRSMNATDLAKCFAGLDEVYFKAYMKLKSQHQAHDDEADDYVEGYAKIFNGSIGLHNPTSGVSDEAWVLVDNVAPGQLIETDINPIKLAGLRELRFNRSDLLSGQNSGLGGINSVNDIATVIAPIMGTIKGAMQMITGFYNYGIMAGWCDELLIEDEHPSYIRLKNADGVKYGGGCRVASVVLDDAWKETLNNNSANYVSNSYGQTYEYTLEDHETSSGVAEYEPLVGGEENPFRKPIRYSSEQMILKDNALMMEEPFNESLYPSPNVGYSRVTVRNIKQMDETPAEVRNAVSGITVHEFYTARDFPVYTRKTDVKHKGYNVSIPIPFVGGKAYKNNGYSQGYAIELNDMHGKPYSVSTYTAPYVSTDPYPGDAGVEPVAATHYYYKTQSPFVRYKTTGNKLDNTVIVLTGDALTAPAEIGKHVDTYVDMRENSVASKSMEFLPNMNAGYVYMLAMLQMFTDNTHAMFRSVTTNKVITRNGILDKQVTTKEGARTVTQNLYYDAETGGPLLATTTNDFDKPIYDYNYAAHWEHEGMKGAYQNAGAIVNSSANGLVQPGDELLKVVASGTNVRYWVENDGSVTDASGTNTTTPITTSGSDYIKIVRSGYRNQQSVPSGNIVSLSDPTSGRNFPLFTQINASTITTSPPVTTGEQLIGDIPDVVDCFTGDTYTDYELKIGDVVNELTVVKGGSGICSGQELGALIITFDASVDFTNSSNFDVTNMVLSKHGNVVKAVSGTKTIYGALKNAECLNECLDNVLHASSAKYSSSWNIDYVDAGVTGITSNTSRYGAENIWRLHETYLFDIDRKQSDLLEGSNAHQTQTGLDGTYENFVLFNWSTQATNDTWTKTNTITQYSPFGYELENEDALGIKSSALYGYDNSVVTAVASNTPYKELGFDGFEDYGSNNYANPSSNYGHLEFGVATTLSTNEAHSGDVSVEIDAPGNVEFTNSIASPVANKFLPVAGQDYYVSAWVKVANSSTTAELKVDGAQLDITTLTDQKIEGWQRLEGKFTAGTTNVSIKFIASGGTVYLDDVRVQPFKSAMKSYVYDTKTLWLKAELDDRNYATFYNYDEEGNLVQIKKETKAGIRTIVSNRKNVKRNPTAATQ